MGNYEDKIYSLGETVTGTDTDHVTGRTENTGK